MLVPLRSRYSRFRLVILVKSGPTSSSKWTHPCTPVEAWGGPSGTCGRKSWGDDTAGLTPSPPGPPDASRWDRSDEEGGSFCARITTGMKSPQVVLPQKGRVSISIVDKARGRDLQGVPVDVLVGRGISRFSRRPLNIASVIIGIPVSVAQFV